MKKIRIVAIFLLMSCCLLVNGQCLIYPSENFLQYQLVSAHGLSFQSAFSQSLTVNTNCGTNFYHSILTNPGQTTATVNAGPLISISVFPNPVFDKLTIQWKSLRLESRYEMINLIGATMYTGIRKASDTESSIDISPYASGIYLLKIISTNNQYQTTFKIIKP